MIFEAGPLDIQVDLLGDRVNVILFLASVCTFMHYFLESFVWRDGTMHHTTPGIIDEARSTRSVDPRTVR